MSRSLMVAAALLVASTVGCGGSDEGPTPTQAPSTTTKTAASTPATPPAELLGTYATALRASDIPKPAPPELADRKWLLRITPDGGIENAPTLTIVRPPEDVLESSTLSVNGDKLEVSQQECAVDTGYDVVSSTYRWTLEGDALRITPIKIGCPDKVQSTILTSHPWKRR